MDEGGVIYFIWNLVNGKRYVGQTTKPLEARMAQHMHGDIVVDKAIQKYGIENFRYGVIKTCATREELNYWEKYFIVALKSKAPYGYNMTDGGDGVVGWTDEMRKRVSVANTGKKRTTRKNFCVKIGRKTSFLRQAPHEGTLRTYRGGIARPQKDARTLRQYF